ncbi:unnamed protein product [Urochloa humidicola]
MPSLSLPTAPNHALAPNTPTDGPYSSLPQRSRPRCPPGGSTGEGTPPPVHHRPMKHRDSNPPPPPGPPTNQTARFKIQIVPNTVKHYRQFQAAPNIFIVPTPLHPPRRLLKSSTSLTPPAHGIACRRHQRTGRRTSSTRDNSSKHRH